MSNYQCFDCGKIVGDEFLRKKVRCPYCGAKMIFKPRTQPTKIDAE